FHTLSCNSRFFSKVRDRWCPIPKSKLLVTSLPTFLSYLRYLG
ncbi:uncharacterized protein PgNI_00627, partial [Pyricularia grisea]|uniref:Uncharacterized protein n=1 Tax=Pyricularia grisea TaxID=148305 RepID=A0A6P8BHX0_PYRGI